RIQIVTPAPPGSTKGNRITALRWSRILREIGHRVTVTQEFSGRRCDLLIALHARRSAQSIHRFRRDYPNRPLLVALTGTDLYGDLRTNSSARRSLALATRLIVLQPDGIRVLPRKCGEKAVVIYQSASTKSRPSKPLAQTFEICVVGHLRSVKDPFRAAMASRMMPRTSRILVTQIGVALTESMYARAEREERKNARYRWLGELSRENTLRAIARSRLLVISSKMEGGANVIAEAVSLSVPILATRIGGNVGMLGGDHAGYFPVGDTRALATLMRRAEEDIPFYSTLMHRCRVLRHLFLPSRERTCWGLLLDSLEASDA
ncbi:MAG: TIGR04348 family glycosyltransferase, partial [Planctomycetes bacterium]|nr:TIGR04348 family glycosyltransferase [Planctomycetota bacterium]